MTFCEPKNHQELLAIFQDVQRQFAKVQLSLASHDVALTESLLKVTDAARRDPFANISLPSNHPFRIAAQMSYAELDKLVGNWLIDVQTHKKNIRFRQRFDDSLLLFVYGKVKAGKSSLGNYIAYGKSNPSAIEISNAQPKPVFFVEDSGDAKLAENVEKMAQHQKFHVDLVEATSVIQGFTRSGLTWVDSPGLHSITIINGALAKEYANSADLIVFLSNSSSPGRHSELEEIRDLLVQGKPMVILITASDAIEFDEDATGELIKKRVMKKDEDRAQQIAYMQQEIERLPSALKQKILAVEVFSISVAYAEEANTDDTDEQIQYWQDSGMADFAKYIAKLAQDQGLQLKREAPLRNLGSFCAKLIDSTAVFESVVNQIGEQLNVVRLEMQRETEYLLASARNELPAKIDYLVSKHHMDNAGFAEACHDEMNRYLQDAASNLLKKLGQQLDQFNRQSQALAVVEEDLPGFAKHMEKRKFTSSFREQAGRAGGGAVLGMVGGAVGAAGGPIGVAIGATLGGLLGSWLGGEAGKNFNKEEIIEIEVGDNREEVALAARNRILKHMELHLADLQKILDQQVFGEIANWLKELSLSLNALQKQVVLQQKSIEQELAKPASTSLTN